MARLTVSPDLARNAVALLVGASCVTVLATAVTTLRRPQPPTIPSDPAQLITQPSVGGVNESSEQIRLAFHAEVETLKAELAEDPTNTSVLLEIATKYQDGHKPADAIPFYQDYLDINETDEQTWLDLASCFAELENWESAESATRRLLQINPSNTSAMYNLGAIRANAGDFATARELWEQIRDQQPHAAVASQAKEALGRLAEITS